MTSAEEAQALFLTQLDVIERTIGFVCRRHHLGDLETSDFRSHTLVKLVEGDYGILRKFEGRSSVRTYLTVVIQRLFLDYRNACWGKWRPSAEARRAGPVAVALEQLIVRDEHTFDEACETLLINRRVPITRRELERLAALLPVRPRRRFESEEVLSRLPSTTGAADHLVESRQHRAKAEEVRVALESALSHMTNQDQLILKMRFEDGRTVAEIATALSLEQKPLYRRLERLLSVLRSRLNASGIEAADALDMATSDAVAIDWSQQASRENALASPSVSMSDQKQT